MTRTPRIIHQIWIQGYNAMPEQYKCNADAWKRINPDWDYRFWDDRSLEALIKTHMPHALARYQSYERPVLRSDLGRIAVLSLFGGIYLDMDTYPDAASLSDTMHFQPGYAYVSYALVPAHFRAIREPLMVFPSNYALAGPANHPYWDLYMDSILSDPTDTGSVRYTGPLAMRQMVYAFDTTNTTYFPKSAFLLPSQAPTPQTLGYHGYDSKWVPKCIRPLTKNMRYLPYDVLAAGALCVGAMVMAVL